VRERYVVLTFLCPL